MTREPLQKLEIGKGHLSFQPMFTLAVRPFSFSTEKIKLYFGRQELEKLGCLRLTYRNKTSPLRVSKEPETTAPNWQVWVGGKGKNQHKEVEVDQSGGSGTPGTTSDPTMYGWGFTGFVAGGKTAYGEIVRQQGINNVLTNTSDAPLKIPKGVKFVGKFGGYAFAVWGAIDIEQQYQSGQINSYWRNAEQVSNGIGAVPVIGTAWSVGWELGRFITQTDFYRYNIKGEYKCVTCPE